MGFVCLFHNCFTPYAAAGFDAVHGKHTGTPVCQFPRPILFFTVACFVEQREINRAKFSPRNICQGRPSSPDSQVSNAAHHYFPASVAVQLRLSVRLRKQCAGVAKAARCSPPRSILVTPSTGLKIRLDRRCEGFAGSHCQPVATRNRLQNLNYHRAACQISKLAAADTLTLD